MARQFDGAAPPAGPLHYLPTRFPHRVQRGQPLPQATSLNFRGAGAAVTVSTQVAVDADGSVKLTAGPAGFHVIIDVTGFTF
jgi:hypothetical protein